MSDEESDDSSDEIINFNGELSSAYESCSDKDNEQLLNVINPRRHLNEPKSINHALKRYKKLNSLNKDNEVVEPMCPNKESDLQKLVDDELKIVEMENNKEVELLFKVLGQENVKPTCESKKVIASWVSGSTLFSAEIESNINSISLFSIPGMSPEIVKAFSEFSKILFPVQQVVIPSLVASCRSVLPPRDFVISAPTGSGKTLCFVLPILNAIRDVRDASLVYALVVAPTQNLASQIFTEFNKYNIFNANIVLLTGNDYEKERSTLFPNNSLSTLSLAHIIVATSSSLVAHLVDKNGTIDLSNLRFLVIDEADHLSNTARIEWLSLVERRANVSFTNNLTIADLTSPKFNRYFQKLLFSATLSLDFDQLHMWNLRCPKLFKADATKSVELPFIQNNGDDNNKHELNNEKLQVVDIILPKNLKQQVIVCLPNMKPIFLYFLISSQKNWKSVLVFVNKVSVSKRLTLLMSYLAKSKFEVLEFSTNLFAKRRKQILKRFEDGKARVLIASDMLSRGIDISNIDCVVNYNPPVNERIFVHRAGRTARGLAAGTVLSIVDKKEKMRLKKMLLSLNAWSDDFVLDRRESEKYLNEDLLNKYDLALKKLQEKCTKK